MTFPRPDHLIFLAHDLDEALDAWRGAGFTVQDRADEKPGSTISRFVVFPDGSYVQIAAFRSVTSIASNRLGPVMAAGGGWADYSFAVDDLDAASRRAAGAGVVLGAVHEVGNSIAGAGPWSLRLLLAGRGASGDDALPFLIQDVGGRELRVPAGAVHANGALGLAGISVATTSPAASAVRLRALVGCASNLSSRPGTIVKIGACAVEFSPLPSDGGIPGPFAVAVQCRNATRPLVLELPGRDGTIVTLLPAVG